MPIQNKIKPSRLAEGKSHPLKNRKVGQSQFESGAKGEPARPLPLLGLAER
jgi:hypothetical protein